jgi:hypothetical protein
MLSVGTLTWYFVLGPAAAEAGLGSVHEAVAALSQPVCDAALVFLGLVVASSQVRPRFSTFLNGGFVALLLADAAYLGLRSVGPYQSGNWPEMLWALGMILLGLTSTTSPEVPADPNVRRIQPWHIVLYWLGPLSPPIHFIILLLWGAMNPPLPAYVLAGCAGLLLYMALRVGLVSSVSKHLGQEREESARVKEQGRLLYELHDTAKQEMHGISLTLRAALDTERRGTPPTRSRAIRKAPRGPAECSAIQLFFVVAFEVAVGDGHTPVAAEGPARDLYARRGLAAFILGPVHELHDATHIVLLEA